MHLKRTQLILLYWGVWQWFAGFKLCGSDPLFMWWFWGAWPPSWIPLYEFLGILWCLHCHTLNSHCSVICLWWCPSFPELSAGLCFKLSTMLAGVKGAVGLTSSTAIWDNVSGCWVMPIVGTHLQLRWLEDSVYSSSRVTEVCQNPCLVLSHITSFILKYFYEARQ